MPAEPSEAAEPDPGAGRHLAPKPMSASRLTTVNLVFPGDTNPRGTIFGGRVLQWIDMIGAMAAQTHCRQVVVTVSMDAVEFRAPIHLGEYAILTATVNRAWRSSMEVQVTVEAEHPLSGERVTSVEAFLTFVALGPDGRSAPVRAVQPETEAEWARYEAAQQRRAARLAFKSEHGG
ncbi:MAG: acyl-CoA thioesterase [Hyphomicrobiaceae bacterium]|nr:acyl-CoA thioesterase [Hyphomicrobiaceae bacterium]